MTSAPLPLSKVNSLSIRSIETHATNLSSSLYPDMRRRSESTGIIEKLVLYADGTRCPRLSESLVRVYEQFQTMIPPSNTDHDDYDEMMCAVVPEGILHLLTTCVHKQYSAVHDHISDGTMAPMMILRGNDVATKIMSACFHRIGDGYYRTALSDAIHELMNVKLPPLVNRAMSSGNERKQSSFDEENQRLLRHHVCAFVNAITSCGHHDTKAYQQMSIVCRVLHNALSTVLPAHAMQLVTSLLFLRQINPIIVKSTQADRVVLVLIAKALQHMSRSGAILEDTNPLSYLNPVIEEQHNTICAYMERLCRGELVVTTTTTTTINSNDDDDDVADAIKVIHDELNAIDNNERDRPMTLRQRLLEKIRRKRRVDIRVVNRNRCSGCIPLIMIVNLVVMIGLFQLFYVWLVV